jgi:protein-S-isoprenylcysteine O-methyltransferase Ste14
MIKRTSVLIYGVLSYALFFGVFTYAILFIGNIGISPSLDSPGDTSLTTALLIDVGLLAAFALQHSIMARPAFKKWWTRIVPKPIERSTFVLAASLLLGATVYFWQPLGGVIWQVENISAIIAIYTIFVTGWAMVLTASFLINHFDLFGLRQVWLYFRGKPYTQLKFGTPSLYRYVRHPLYVGFLIGLWAAPTMTVAHLVFSLLSTGYIVIGALLEERDLEKALPEYKQYKKEVPMFLPRFNNKIKTATVGEAA